jgi:hypothetical protein
MKESSSGSSFVTRDNVPMTVDAVVYFRVVDPEAAVVRVENYLKATSLISQTTLRSVLGQAELDELLEAVLTEKNHLQSFPFPRHPGGRAGNCEGTSILAFPCLTSL